MKKRFVGISAALVSLIVTTHMLGQQAVELPKIGPKVAELINETPLVEDDSGTALQKVLNQKHNAALAEVKIRYQEYQAGVDTENPGIFDAALRLLDAKLDLAETLNDKRILRQQFIELSEEFETLAASRVNYRGDSRAYFERMRYDRLKVQADLLRN